MAQRPDSTLPPVPNYSFNPGPNVSTGPAEIQIQKQQQEQQQYQNEISTIAKTAQMASGLVQSFVEASKQRQQADALRAYAQFDPNKPIVSTDQTGTMSAVPYGQTPAGQATRAHLLAQVLATNPDLGAQAIIKQALPPPPNSMEQILARQFSQTGQAPASTIQTIQQTKAPQTTKTGTIVADGKATPYTMQAGVMKDASTGTVLNDGSHKLEPYVTPSDYATKRERIAALGQIQHMGDQIKNVLVNSPVAKTVVAADNFLNQIERAKDGSVIVDKPTATMFATELDRALTGSGGQVSEERIKDLIPSTLRSHAADIGTYVSNHPQDKDVKAFLNNYAVEVKAQRDQRGAALQQALSPILSSASLAQQDYPDEYKKTIRGIGLDPDEAIKGNIKFLPGTNSVLYGSGRGDTGLPLQSPQDLAALKASVRKKLGL